jgi:hypothetical protein
MESSEPTVDTPVFDKAFFANNPGWASNLLSTILATVHGRNTCDLHDDCDGSCSGTVNVHLAVRSCWADTNFTMPPQPRMVNSSLVCRDECGWLSRTLRISNMMRCHRQGP